MKFSPPVPEGEDKQALAIFKKAWQEHLESYERHLDGLGHLLPPSIVELAKLPRLEDALIAAIIIDTVNRRLRLTLRCGDLVTGYFDLSLTYYDVEMSEMDRDQLVFLARSTVDSGEFQADFYRHEIDGTQDGKIEHRLEFFVFGRPNVWFSIKCREISWSIEDRPSRDLPAKENRIREEALL
jgi:hypothetical protein